jgi:hypothetical protein
VLQRQRRGPPRELLDAPEQYAGRFIAKDGDRFDVVVSGGDVRLRKNGRDSALYCATDRLFATDDPDHAITGIVIESGWQGGACLVRACGIPDRSVDRVQTTAAGIAARSGRPV